MFAVGHLALGYLAGKGSQRLLKASINLPVVFLFSLISDADLLLPGLAHRTATHSLIIMTLAFLPSCLLLGKRSLPYFAAAVQHPLVGDLLTNGGSQLLWPLSRVSFGLGLEMQGWAVISVEWVSFLFTVFLLVRTRDLRTLFTSHKSNLLLLIPAGVILLSAVLGFGYNLPPKTLLIPHLVFLGIFMVSILSFVRHGAIWMNSLRVQKKRF